MFIELTDINFNQEVIKSCKSVIVEFTASWCGVANIVEPIINRNIIKYNGSISFGRLNVEKEKNTALMYGISSIPTFLFFENGRLLEKIVGSFSNSDLENIIISVFKNVKR